MTTREYRKASAEIKRRYRRKLRSQRSFVSAWGAPLLMGVVIIACIVSIISNKVELDAKQAELAELRAQAEVLEAENATYENILYEKDERAYMELIATEKLGYAYPDERRYYDTVQLS